MTTITRYAIVTARLSDNVGAYLPANYDALYSEKSEELQGWYSVVIAGKDSHGWTLDDYVIPRLASGLMNAQEIDLSHPIMKRVGDRGGLPYQRDLPGGMLA